MHELRHLSNEALLQRYQKADASAFSEFFKRHEKLVYNYLLSRLKNPADADEAFQKTFFRVHRYVSSYDPTQNALGWLMTITRNVAIDEAKARPNAEMVNIDDNPLESPHHEESAIEARDCLREIIEGLSPEERDLLEKRLLEDDSYEQIGLESGLSVPSVRKRFSRLLKRLKLELATD